MNLRLLTIYAAFWGSLCPSTAIAKEELSMQEILSIAKMTGACGILQAQSAFQVNTKLEGGDKFIERFWSTEAARLGKPPDQYIKDCQASIAAYESMWKLAGEKEK
ncbi:hypothetical protein SAMN05421882_101756 [Nitrosomonas communis]|uniref:Uncharacterized protein n=2 Tax=Nitrosomonas communis TaxID=44574 RepID=A0A1H2US92_9PROT|nr:hypothetical protein SAMN05421882_101756 [Nitrosomonas communis]